MKAGSKWCCVLALGLAAFGVTAYGQELRLEPVSATGTGYVITSNMGIDGVASEIMLDCRGAEVLIEIMLSGWGSAPGAPVLGAYQVTIDSLGSGIAVGDIYTCGTDLCPKGFPADPNPDGAEIDTTDPRFVYFNNAPLAALFVGTLDYEFGSTTMGTFPADPGGYFYGGLYTLEVDANAVGTSWTVIMLADPNKTLMADAAAENLPGVYETGVVISLKTGKCCYDLGPTTVQCADGITACECDDLTAMGLQNLFFPGDVCDPGDPNDCPSCTDGPFPSVQCSDADSSEFGGVPHGVCTDDWCVDYVCENIPNFDLPAANCCNSLTGELTAIDDGNDCTEDVCDHITGLVAHNPLTGTACDHVNACVINDECVAGVCEGDLPGDLDITCADDTGCPSGWFCNLDTLKCDCRLSTPLCIEFDDDCYEEDAAVLATIQMLAGTSAVTGGQFLMTYDPDCLEFVAIGPCAGDTMFIQIVDWYVDEVAGKIWYAMIAYDEATHLPTGSDTGPAALACIDFIKTDDCDPCEMCFISENPYNTLLSDDEGNSVDLLLCDDTLCSEEIVLDGEVTIHCPPGADVDVDCNSTGAVVTWDAPWAEDECLGPLEVDCIADHDGGMPISEAMILNGGSFPQGKTYFYCYAENECESIAECVWTVDVSSVQTLDVEVDLSPDVFDGVLTRCIQFLLYYDCAAPQEICAEVVFGPPYNFANHGVATLDVDKGNFDCIEARDPLHTLRSFSEILCDPVTGKWTAVFKGDPLMNPSGVWLVGGNLDFYAGPGNGPNHIDVLDFGVYMWQAGVTYGYGADTACGADCAEGLYPNADVNADGKVDAEDYALLSAYFLAESKLGCCGMASAGALEPVLEISVKELRRRGMGELAAGDLNNDGWLDLQDMALYTQGERPVAEKVKRGR